MNLIQRLGIGATLMGCLVGCGERNKQESFGADEVINYRKALRQEVYDIEVNGKEVTVYNEGYADEFYFSVGGNTYFVDANTIASNEIYLVDRVGGEEIRELNGNIGNRLLVFGFKGLRKAKELQDNIDLKEDNEILKSIGKE